MWLEKKLNKLNFDTPFETQPLNFAINQYWSFTAKIARIWADSNVV
ncbi:hypothetical protein DFP78_10494 [Photobacterium lutimaris]|nr:hypothetical protein DFP78_10494 [Photobacterium lutimaris]